jgi:hypothetical protein
VYANSVNGFDHNTCSISSCEAQWQLLIIRNTTSI